MGKPSIHGHIWHIQKYNLDMGNIYEYMAVYIYIYMLMMGDGIENWDIAGISFWKITVIYTITQS